MPHPLTRRNEMKAGRGWLAAPKSDEGGGIGWRGWLQRFRSGRSYVNHFASFNKGKESLIVRRKLGLDTDSFSFWITASFEEICLFKSKNAKMDLRKMSS
jgi:hypothetical protein